jgi:hypothetical protein
MQAVQRRWLATGLLSIPTPANFLIVENEKPPELANLLLRANSFVLSGSEPMLL